MRCGMICRSNETPGKLCEQMSRQFKASRSKNFLTVMLLALCWMMRAPCGRAQAPVANAKDYAAAKSHAHAVAKEWLAKGIPGVTLAVAVDGKIVYTEGFGYADVEQRVPVWPTTKFRIASDSKPLTAAGLMLLVEQGKIDLDAPVQTYVPSFPDKGAK